MSSIPDGKYNIVSVVYPDRAAALLDPTSEVVTRTFDASDLRLIWYVKNSGTLLQASLQNDAFGTFVDKEMRGETTAAPVQWILIPVGNSDDNQFQISVDTLAWTPTSDGEDAEVALEPLDPSSIEQRWTFKSQ